VRAVLCPSNKASEYVIGRLYLEQSCLRTSLYQEQREVATSLHVVSQVHTTSASGDASACAEVDRTLTWTSASCAMCVAGNPLWEVRLVDGSTSREGRVQASTDNSTWGPICDDGFDDDDAKVICRMLGYTRSVSTHKSSRPPSYSQHTRYYRAKLRLL